MLSKLLQMLLEDSVDGVPVNSHPSQC